MKFFLFVVTVIFICCNSQVNERVMVVDKFDEYVPKDTGVQYFLNDSLTSASSVHPASIDSFKKRWYSETLFNLHEPVLYNYSGRGESIRLLWLRAFDNPLVVRVNKIDGTVYANIKELQNQSGRQFLKDTIISLDTSRWNKILSELEKSNFWSGRDVDTSLGKDGIAWLLECRLANKYHTINRWDDGSLSSNDLNYANELINLGKSFVEMKSSK